VDAAVDESQLSWRRLLCGCFHDNHSSAGGCSEKLPA